MENKKAQIQGVVLAVITLLIVGIILVFMNHMDKAIYQSFDDNFASNPELNNTEAHTVVKQLNAIEGTNIWDYVFLAVFIGMFIQMIILAFASKTNVLFFWIYTLLGLIVLIVGTAVSNMWQQVASDPTLATTITRFPITNTILGSYFPTIVTGFIFLGMIFIFGKFPGETGGKR
jgi:hypothetical protein